MSDTYPVVKIPPSIANAKPQIIERITVVDGKSIQPPTNSHLVMRCRQIGYGLLFLSTLIFAVAVVRDVKIIPYSVISFCLGFAAVNIASLLDPPQTSTHQQTIKTIETIPVDYKSLLEGKIIEPSNKVATDAQKGVSEQHFEKYLNKYFSDILYPSYEFNLTGKYKYSSDFTLILANRISLIVEVDEPYNGKDKMLTHCTDVDKDYNRDLFFVNGNWIVIRFSEFQVCAYPIKCCYVIARTIDSIDLNSNLSRQFKGVKDLPADRRWNTRQAIQMVQQDYRLGYLEKYGVYKQKEAQTSKLLPLKRRIQR